MKLSQRTVLAAALATITVVALSADVGAIPADVTIGTIVQETDGGPATPGGADDWFAGQRTYGTPGIDLAAAQSRARDQAQALISANRTSLTGAAAWTSMGPTLGGRITDMAADPTQANVVYAGAASGGLWKSTDAGLNYTYNWSIDRVQGVGAVAIASNGHIYVGTGEGNPGGGSASYPGNGVYKSTDHGATFQLVGLTGTDRIGRIAIDPTNPNRVFVAAAGKLFSPTTTRGLYATTDGGATWRLALAGANGNTGAIDVTINPADPNLVHVAMWDHHRTPGNSRIYGGVGSGIFRSTDGGNTFARATGLPASSSNLGRMGVAVSQSDPNRMYAIANNTSGGFTGMWTSTNRGTSWTQLTNTSAVASAMGGYGWWYGRVFIDPRASQHIWVIGVSMAESTNAGGSWTTGAPFHVDQHGVAVDPAVSGRVYVGNDGGAYRSTANGSLGSSWTKARGLSNMQFYTVATSKQDPSRVSGGLQDNGSVRSWAGWGSIWGGDGLQNLIDPTNHNKVYACSQNGSCGRSTDGGNSMPGFGGTTSSRRAWLTPVVFDPTNPSIMYYGGNQLNRSTNSAASFSVISGDLSRGAGQISTIAAAKTDGRIIYAGTDDGRMWVTRNTGTSWTEITAGLPTRWITRVTVDPTDANLAYVTVSGHAWGSATPHVFRTTNGGSTWTGISGNLPDAPVNDIVLDPLDRSILYVGTDAGAYVSTNTGGSWSPIGTGLPVVPIMDLEPQVSGGRTLLTAATYGLGIYRIAPTPMPVGDDFSMSVTPGSGTATPGGSTTATVGTAVTNGAAQNVALSASGLPAGATATFNPTSVTAGGSSSLTVSTTESTPPGSYPITITGTGTSITHTATYTLTVSGGTTPTPTPTPTGTPGGCAGYETTFPGSLASGASAYHPNNSYFQTTVTGPHRACLDGPAGADYDLYLQKWNGSAWANVASGASPAADETLSYTGTAGYYRYRVHAYSGSGSYTVAYDAP